MNIDERSEQISNIHMNQFESTKSTMNITWSQCKSFKMQWESMHIIEYSRDIIWNELKSNEHLMTSAETNWIQGRMIEHMNTIEHQLKIIGSCIQRCMGRRFDVSPPAPLWPMSLACKTNTLFIIHISRLVQQQQQKWMNHLSYLTPPWLAGLYWRMCLTELLRWTMISHQRPLGKSSTWQMKRFALKELHLCAMM